MIDNIAWGLVLTLPLLLGLCIVCYAITQVVFSINWGVVAAIVFWIGVAAVLVSQ